MCTIRDYNLVAKMTRSPYCNIILLAIGLLSSSIQGQPMSDKSSMSSGSSSMTDYYNDDYYQMTSDDEYLSEEERVVHKTPTFKTEEKDTFVNEGDTITLPCFVDTLDGFVLMWKRGEKDYIAIGEHLQGGNPRFKLMHSKEKGKTGNRLVISLAEPQDAGDYICEMSSAKKIAITHHVRVRVAPQVRANPSDVVIVREGESATLACDVVKGSPQPEITWTRKDRKMPNGAKQIVGTSVTLPSVSRRDSGNYICSADNGFGDPATALIQLDVQHKPQIETEQTFIHTREGDNAEVVCIVHSSPKAKVEWFKNGRPLGEREGHISTRGNKHSLHLFSMKEQTFGTYSCRAENKLGMDEKSTQVSGRAAPPNFRSESLSSDEDKFVLEWVAESISNISTFKVEYRPKMSDSWESTNSVTDARGDSEGWTEVTVRPVHAEKTSFVGKHVLQGLIPQTRYIARVSSKNDYGYNKPKTFEFGTKGAAPLHPAQPSVSSSTTIATSSILVAGAAILLLNIGMLF